MLKAVLIDPITNTIERRTSFVIESVNIDIASLFQLSMEDSLNTISVVRYFYSPASSESSWLAASRLIDDSAILVKV